MGKYVRSIPVEDASGAGFQIHEYLVRRHVFDYVCKRRRFVLDTGEEVEPVDAHTFAIVATGEPLCVK